MERETPEEFRYSQFRNVKVCINCGRKYDGMNCPECNCKDFDYISKGDIGHNIKDEKVEK